jgi:hypothetical protein
MNDINGLSKTISDLQKSLKITAESRKEERKNKREMTMMDLLGKFQDNEELYAMFELQQQKILDKYKNSKHTDVDEYMTIHTATEILDNKTDKKKDK